MADVIRREDDELRLTLADDRDVRDEAGDAGKTAGGGSLGHDQAADVRRESPARNATGSEDDPVMPQDDATLKTKI